ncbi:hypothetical protein BMS3Abin17_01002 [archaeon BMS3Abin17]|nr:hypothetical protein BMS3Abin17_01002 [archaeon BMS3Abin17]HDZ60479.1 hypothetical protein [Candidatus Pacearchaeota archaeon]
MIHKKGLSTIVTTLIIILLVLVAIGIVWVVIMNVVEDSTGQINTNTKCLSVSLEASSVVCSNETTCNISIYRKPGGDALEGVKLIFENAAGDRSLTAVDVSGNIAELGTSKSEVNTGISNATKVEMTPYFADESGNENLCPEATSSSFDGFSG